MQKPQIQIINSMVYNNAIRRWLGRDEYLSDEELDQYRASLEAKWNEGGEKIVDLIMTCLGWPWKDAVIKAYVTGTKASFSNPLTVGYKKDIDLAFNILTHELIHCYISQSIPELRKRIDDFYTAYPNDSRLTQNHIMVHAIHENIYRKTNRIEELEADVKSCQSAPDYAKSWEIVDQVGYKEILKRLAQ
ncbi:MAG: hypothetical protein Q8Q05_02025 [bacterium]|nr:hypothetical protein [bacterium]